MNESTTGLAQQTPPAATSWWGGLSTLAKIGIVSAVVVGGAVLLTKPAHHKRTGVLGRVPRWKKYRSRHYAR
jgi:hypothetical protein